MSAEAHKHTAQAITDSWHTLSVTLAAWFYTQGPLWDMWSHGSPFWLAIVWRFPWIQDTLCMHLQFKLIFIWNGSLIQNLKNKQLKAFDDRPTLRRTKLLFLRQNWRFCFKWPFSGAHFPLNQITHNNSWISLPLSAHSSTTRTKLGKCFEFTYL